MKVLKSPHKPVFEEICYRKKGREGLLDQRANKTEKELSHASFLLGNLCTAMQKVHKYSQHSDPDSTS